MKNLKVKTVFSILLRTFLSMLICGNCNVSNSSQFRFCKQCGTKLENNRFTLNTKNNYKPYIIFLVFAVSSLIYTLIYEQFDYYYGYDYYLYSDLLLIILSIYYVSTSKLSFSKLYKAPKFNRNLFTLLLFILPPLAIGNNMLIDYLNYLIFHYTDYYYYDFLDTNYPVLLSIISIAIIPAIFEELVFRGIIFNELLKTKSLKKTIFITSILFTAIHFSILSIYWLFPFSLLLGYLRAKYRSLWYSMFVHFIYNLTAILFEIYNYYYY